jgi:ATP-dependent RNA helicase RhlE
VNYELPGTPEDYVHRIGRTGRAGKSGTAASLVAPEETPRLAAIERLIKFKIPQASVPGFGADTTEDELRARRPVRHSRERQAPAASPSTSSSASRSRSKPHNVTEDGFDFDQPYVPAGSSAGQPSASAIAAEAHAQPARKTVAFLLGGSGRDR